MGEEAVGAVVPPAFGFGPVGSSPFVGLRPPPSVWTQARALRLQVAVVAAVVVEAVAVDVPRPWLHPPCARSRPRA